MFQLHGEGEKEGEMKEGDDHVTQLLAAKLHPSKCIILSLPITV